MCLKFSIVWEGVVVGVKVMMFFCKKGVIFVEIVLFVFCLGLVFVLGF